MRKELSRLSILPEEPAAIYRTLARVAFDSARINPNLYRLIYDTDIPELLTDEELKEAYVLVTRFFWERIPRGDYTALTNEINLFELLMNSLILRHLKIPERYTSENYFKMIDVALKRFFV